MNMNSNIDKFEDWMPFYNKDINVSSDEIMKIYKEFCEKYPEIRMLKLESDYSNGTRYWLYSLNKKSDTINIDLFLEISKKNNWSLNFELVMECEDEYLVNNKTDKSYTQDEKHFEKMNLNWDELNFNMKKVFEWVRKWNLDFFKENGFYPLVD